MNYYEEQRLFINITIDIRYNKDGHEFINTSLPVELETYYSNIFSDLRINIAGLVLSYKYWV